MRIKDKIEEIEDYLEEFLEIMPETLEEYRQIKTRAACERYFEKIIEAVVDLAFFIIKEKKLKVPEEDKEAFDILLKDSIISQKLCENLKEAKGMRNLIVHEYGKIDDEIVFQSITEQLEKDIKEFLLDINNNIK